MDQAQFVSLVEEILEVPAGTVDMDDNLVEIDWDSLANISLIAEIDNRTGRTISPEGLAASTTVGDLYALLQQP